MKFVPAVAVASFVCPMLAVAEESAHAWGLGLGAAVSSSPYAGVGTTTLALPLLSYESENLFFSEITGGYHLYNANGFGMDVIVSGRLDGIDRDDFGRRELASNGIRRELLDNRDNGVDAGVALKWRGTVGELTLLAKTDVSGASNGQEASLIYGYQAQWGRAKITPSVGITYLSNNLVNYYYGTHNAEIARGVSDYQPGSVTVPHVALNVVRPLGENWLVTGNLKYSVLPDKITDSPLVEDDIHGRLSLSVGLSMRF